MHQDVYDIYPPPLAPFAPKAPPPPRARSAERRQEDRRAMACGLLRHDGRRGQDVCFGSKHNMIRVEGDAASTRNTFSFDPNHATPGKAGTWPCGRMAPRKGLKRSCAAKSRWRRSHG